METADLVIGADGVQRCERLLAQWTVSKSIRVCYTFLWSLLTSKLIGYL